MILRFNKEKKVELIERLDSIREGDKLEREQFIKDYIPFIIKSISKVTKSYVDLCNCDEYSIALIAFNDAIDSYNYSKGSFLNYANIIIRNRVIDHMRKNRRFSENNISIDNVEDIEDDYISKGEINAKEQINIFIEKLGAFNITMEDLVEESPKHVKGRIRSIKIARYVIDRNELKIRFYRLKRLPMKLLSEIFKITIKTLKRTKKFTIATAIVLDSNLNYLKSRIIRIERGNDDA